MKVKELFFMLLGGALFGFGLAYSGMIIPEVVLRFLTLKDFGLMLVMGGAVLVTLVFYQLAPRLMAKPILGKIFDKRLALFDRKLIIGAAIFGIGWGVCGVCPGPAIAALGVGNFKMLWVLAGIFFGAYIQGRQAVRS